jgi:organic radical activating enzyme
MTISEQGYVQELFSSIQGEGLWAGRFHHFVRLAGCSVGCRYCDTPLALRQPGHFPVPGGGHEENPVTVQRLVDLTRDLEKRRPGAQALAITGGEPLEQAEFLRSFVLELKKQVLGGRPVLLETSGLHPDSMHALRGLVDMVSMDVKLFSSSGLHNILPIHERFMEALRGTKFFVKVVANKDSTEEEIAEAAMLVASKDSSVPFFIQPETREGAAVSGAYLLDLWEVARTRLQDVRIQPQIHRILDLR